MNINVNILDFGFPAGPMKEENKLAELRRPASRVHKYTFYIYT